MNTGDDGIFEKEYNQKLLDNSIKVATESDIDIMNAKVDKALEKKRTAVNNEPETNAQITEDSTIEEIKYVDLFCGLGAFHTAFDRHNKFQQKKKYTCVFASDIDEGVRNIYQENYGLNHKGIFTRLK